MSLKWKELARALEEANPRMAGTVLQKIAQVRGWGGETFLLQGYGEGGAWRLWISLFQNQCATCLLPADAPIEAESKASHYVMILRKNLLGKEVVGIRPCGNDRLFALDFTDGQRLLGELVPNRGNLLLLKDWNEKERAGRCVASFRKVSLQPGALYVTLPPPQAARPDARDFSAGTGPLAYNYAIARHFTGQLETSDFASEKRRWLQAIKSALKKVRQAAEKTTAELAAAREAELFQARGLALTGILYELGPRAFPKQTKMQIGALEVPLDKAKSFADNAEYFFRKAKKFGRATGELERHQQELQERQSAGEKLAKDIEAAADEAALESLREKLTELGISPEERPAGGKSAAPGAKPFLSFVSSDGFTIYCGRTQEENRTVTFQEAKGNDIWMHAKGVPGAHVVIKIQKNKTVPLSTLLEAAQATLYYSKIRGGKKAEVDYTQRKNVRAIKGTLAEVTYTGNKTLYVEADGEKLKKILQT